MKVFAFAVVTALGLFVNTLAQAAMTINFNANAGSQITFSTPSGVGQVTTVKLTPGLVAGATDNFYINAVNGATGTPGFLVQGSIVGNGFWYDASAVTTSGTKQTATLNSFGTNTFRLTDGNGIELTATIGGVNIVTDGTQGGTNSNGQINLTGISYLGNNADLIQLRNEVQAGGGIATISFQFTPQMSLTQLAAAGSFSNSYSMAVSTVPEPGSLALAFTGVTMLGLGCYRQHRRKQV